MKRRALISVYDKTCLPDLAKRLVAAEWELVSTGGTAAHLRENGLAVTDVSSLTKTPECLGGRVKTLHPAIHGGILARRDNPDDMASLEAMGVAPLDLVVVNLYPFFEKVQDESLSVDAIIEFIDIGGPSMLRAAAKNYKWVTVLTDPGDYGAFFADHDVGFRRYLAAKAFNLTSAYDAAVASYLFAASAESEPLFSPFFTRSYCLSQPLRYGENAHQSAALYVDADRPGLFGSLKVLQGKELSYNNMRDIDAAWSIIDAARENLALGDSVFCVAVKHNQPCGAAVGKDSAEAYRRTFDGDPVSIFGGILACSAVVDENAAVLMADTFLEVIIAPSFTSGARDAFVKKKNLRLVEVGEKVPQKGGAELLSVSGGLLVQTIDDRLFEKWDVVTKEKPSSQQEADLRFGMMVAQGVKSNAIVVVRDGQTRGICGGQTNRIWAAEEALKRASEKGSLTNCVLVSDGFFPFSDCVDAAAAYGIKAILQPGGSIRDQESIDACDEAGIAMVFSGTRHFKH